MNLSAHSQFRRLSRVSELKQREKDSLRLKGFGYDIFSSFYILRGFGRCQSAAEEQMMDGA